MHYLEQIASVFISLKQSLGSKVLISGLITLYSFFFGINLSMIMLALMALITFDLLTGIIAAYVAGEPIESHKIFRSAMKFGVYLILVSAAHLTDTTIFGDIHLEEGMIGFLAVTELISIIENAGKMGYVVPKKLLNRLNELRGA